MRRFTGIGVLLLGLIVRLYADNGDTLIQTQDPKSFQIYVCMGQSNMVGVAFVDAADTGLIPRVWKANLNDPTDTLLWQAWHWTSQDIGKYGMCLTMPFGRYLTQQDNTIQVGLINTAVGSTSINDWCKGSALYNASIVRAREAMKEGVLAGVIWNQGDTDAHMVGWADSVAKMIRSFRSDLNLPELPWVLGQIMQNSFDSTINADVVSLADTLPYTAYANSDSLTSWAGDPCGGCHFSAESYDIFGIRYGQQMIALQNKISASRVIQPEKLSAMLLNNRTLTGKLVRYDLRGRAISGATQMNGHVGLIIVRQNTSTQAKMAITY